MIRRGARSAPRRQGRAHAAASASQLTLDLAPTPEPAMRSGSVLDATERLARAAAERSRVQVRAAPSTAEAATAEQWFELACELESESSTEAIAAYHRVLELEPTLSDAHVNLGRLYHQAREHAKAEVHYRAATQSAPQEAIAWFNLGVLFEDMHRSHEAVHAYHEAIEREDEHADAHYNLGLLYDELGQRAEAMSHLMQARRLYSQSQPQ